METRSKRRQNIIAENIKAVVVSNKRKRNEIDSPLIPLKKDDSKKGKIGEKSEKKKNVSKPNEKLKKKVIQCNGEKSEKKIQCRQGAKTDKKVSTPNEKLNDKGMEKKEKIHRTNTPLIQNANTRSLAIRLDRAELIYPEFFEAYRKSKNEQIIVSNEQCISQENIENIEEVSRKRKYIDMTRSETLEAKKVIGEKNSIQSNNKGATRKKKNLKRQCTEIKEKILNEAPSNEYVKDEIVLGTIPGYCPWPARIVDILGETIFIEFFGTGEINPVRSNAISRFELAKVIPYLKRKGFKKAVQELEMVLRIPSDMSVLKQ